MADAAKQTIEFYHLLRVHLHRVRDIRLMPDGHTYGWVNHQGQSWVVRKRDDTEVGPGLATWMAWDGDVTLRQLRGEPSSPSASTSSTPT